MEIQNEKEAFERFKAKQIGIDYETLKKDLDDCEKRFPNNRYAGWNFKSDWELWQAAKAQAVPEWISVEDRLPSDGPNIIAFDAIKHCVFKDGEFLQGYFEPDTGHEYTEPVDVTHWIAIEAQEPTND